MANYAKGRRFEYEIKDILEAAGYTCLRTAGSHGEYDLVAYKRTGRNIKEIGLLQLKVSKEGGLLASTTDEK